MPFACTAGVRTQLDVRSEGSEPRDTTLPLRVGLGSPSERGGRAPPYRGKYRFGNFATTV